MAKVFVIEMTPNLDGLHTIPEGVKGPIGVFYAIVVQSWVAWGKAKGGVEWEGQAIFRQIRSKMEEGMNTNDPKLRLSANEYKFLTTMFKESKGDPTANEAIWRIGGLIFTAKPEETEEKPKE